MKIRVYTLKSANRIFNDLSEEIETLVNNNTVIEDGEDSGELMELTDFEVITVNNIPYLILKYKKCGVLKK